MIFVSYSTCQVFDEKKKIVAKDRSVDAHFGNSSSIFKNYIVIGASSEKKDAANDNSLDRAGAAYIYHRESDGIWEEKQKIVASDRRPTDYFASSVSLYDSILAIGSPQSDLNELALDSIESAGAVYIYKLNNTPSWVQTQKIAPNDRVEQDWFGQSVAVRNDYLVAGAHQHDFDENGLNEMENSGAVYVFKKNILGDWQQTQKLIPSDRDTNMMFGWSLSMSDDYIVVGARNKKELNGDFEQVRSAGAVYIYKQDVNGFWIEHQKITASDLSEWDSFGYSVSIDNENIIVGAMYKNGLDENSSPISYSGAAYIFSKQQNGLWEQSQKLEASDKNSGDIFGCSVSISKNYLLIGSYRNNDLSKPIYWSGAVYVYKKHIDSIWRETQKLTPIDAGELDSFGFSASLHEDYAVITAYHDGDDDEGINYMKYAGSAYVFEKCSVDTEVNNHVNYLSSAQNDASYQWIDCGNSYTPIIGEINQTFYPLQNGNYAVEVSYNGCVDTSFCSTISAANININKKNKISIHPNPNNGNFILEFEIKSNYTIYIADLLGKEVFNINSNMPKIEINLEQPKGVYFLYVINDNGEVRIFKIILQ
jgi:hypothetical protein